MKINKLVIDENEISVSLSGYGCNSNSHSDNKILKIKHKSNLESTLAELGVELV